MKNNFFNITSIIAKRISKKMSKIYITIYFSLLMLLFVILIPALYAFAVNDATHNLFVITDEFILMQDSIRESLNTIEINQNLLSNIETYYSNYSEASKAKVNLELGETSSINSNVLILCLEDKEGNFFSSFSHSYFDKKGYLSSQEGYIRLIDTNYSSYFSPLIVGEFETDFLDIECFSYSKNMSLSSRDFVASVFYDATSYIKGFQEFSNFSFDDFIVINRYDKIVYETSKTDIYEKCIIDLSNISKTSGFIKKWDGLYFYNTIPSSTFTLIAYAPYSKLFSTASIIIGIITFLYVLSPILYIMFLAPVTQRQLAPLKNLSDAMTNYTIGNDVNINIQTGDEIEVVGNALKTMVSEISSQINEIKAKEHENSLINYKLLTTQVDPHFIYNTMHIVSILAQEGNTEAVVEINSALTKILRERLNTKLNNFGTIKNEIDTIMQYCLITDYRFKNTIEVIFDIDEAIEDKLIPKNILQPLVENAFFHGFSDNLSRNDATIGIIIYSVGNEIIIEVSDNGQGIDEKRVNQLLNSSDSIYNDNKPHIGIDNIRQRLSYLYSKDYNFNIQSAPNKGTTVIITVPEIDNTNNENN